MKNNMIKNTRDEKVERGYKWWERLGMEMSGIELDFDEDVSYEFDEKGQGCEKNETKGGGLKNEKEEFEWVKWGWMRWKIVLKNNKWDEKG